MTMRSSWLMLTAGVISVTLPAIAQQPTNSDEHAIRELIVQSYVNGVFKNRDPAAVRAGFHPDFVMTVHTGDTVIVATREMWLERLNLDGAPSTTPVEYVIRSVDVTGQTAVVKMEIYEDGARVYSDYLGLYRFSRGWRIVNKVFQEHQ